MPSSFSIVLTAHHRRVPHALLCGRLRGGVRHRERARARGRWVALARIVGVWVRVAVQAMRRGRCEAAAGVWVELDEVQGGRTVCTRPVRDLMLTSPLLVGRVGGMWTMDLTAPSTPFYRIHTVSSCSLI